MSENIHDVTPPRIADTPFAINKKDLCLGHITHAEMNFTPDPLRISDMARGLRRWLLETEESMAIKLLHEVDPVAIDRLHDLIHKIRNIE